MDRRDFLRMVGACGVVLTFREEATAAQDSFKGPFWISICADGGWDPTSLFDPKGKPVNAFEASAIREAGPFRYAPYMGPARSVLDPTTQQMDDQDFYDRFFQKYQNDLLVIRGLDMGTNSHVTGRAYALGGKLGQSWPAISALAAACMRPDLPMSYLSQGTYAETGGLVAATRTGTGQGFVSSLSKVAQPNVMDSDIWDNLVRPAMNTRSGAAAAAGSKRANILQAVRTSTSRLDGLTQYLPASTLTAGNPLFAQAELVAAAFKAGVAVGASLQLGGFDTHANHDQLQFARMDDLLRGIDYLMKRLEALQLREQVTIVVASDFGRMPLYGDGTTGYNDKMGKDHYPITGMMMLGRGINGGRVIGGTDEKVNPLKVNPVTLKLDPIDGIILRPEMVHVALRNLAGIQDNPLLEPYLIDAPKLPLLEGPK